MHFTGTIWRPPYEAPSTLIQATAGCTHNKCKFCTLYEELPFKFRMSPISEIEQDLIEASTYQRNSKRIFFTGANPFVLSFNNLKQMAQMVQQYFPNCASVGCFARITDITSKTNEELRQLRALGYNSITIGVEAGDDEALEFMNKGFGTKQIIEECKRLDEAGIEYNFFYLAGIYGHLHGELGAKNTADIFNQTKPKIIINSMLTVYESSKLFNEIQEGNWTEQTEIEKLHELRTLISHLNIPTYLATMGASNCVLVDGNLPEDKQKMIEYLDGVIKTADERELRLYRETLPHL